MHGARLPKLHAFHSPHPFFGTYLKDRFRFFCSRRRRRHLCLHSCPRSARQRACWRPERCPVRRPCTTQDSGRETRDRGSASSRRAATSQRMLEAITSNLGLQSSANSFRVWARRAQSADCEKRACRGARTACRLPYSSSSASMLMAWWSP